MNSIRVGKLTLGGKNKPLFVIAGPCVIENEAMVMKTTETLAEFALTLTCPSYSSAVTTKPTGRLATVFAAPACNADSQFSRR